MKFTVNLWWDDTEPDEVPMWIAESDDILGLVLENESLDKLIDACKDVIPSLLVGNKQVPSNKLERVTVSFLVKVPVCG
ncbi:hypothetical protein FACS1894200_01920 [Spirochaetia bacterium]|nr:hypothetical protein FACS1894200_01920 [Spirochaetia bacterium]